MTFLPFLLNRSKLPICSYYFFLFWPVTLQTLNGSSTVLVRSEEHTSELQSHLNLVCRLLLEKNITQTHTQHHTSTHTHTKDHTPSHTHTQHQPTPSLTHAHTSPHTHTHTLSFLIIRKPPKSTLFPYTNPFR